LLINTKDWLSKLVIDGRGTVGKQEQTGAIQARKADMAFQPQENPDASERLSAMTATVGKGSQYVKVLARTKP